MDDIDRELQGLSPFPPDFHAAMVTFLNECSKNGFYFAGMAINRENSFAPIVSNLVFKNADRMAKFSELFTSFSRILSGDGNNTVIDVILKPDGGTEPGENV